MACTVYRRSKRRFAFSFHRRGCNVLENFGTHDEMHNGTNQDESLLRASGRKEDHCICLVNLNAAARWLFSTKTMLLYRCPICSNVSTIWAPLSYLSLTGYPYHFLLNSKQNKLLPLLRHLPKFSEAIKFNPCILLLFFWNKIKGLFCRVAFRCLS
jgi:hypothetical protein